MNDIVDTRGRISADKRHRRLKRSGSCVSCGAEAQKNRIRCLPCGKVNTAGTKRRATALAGEDKQGSSDDKQGSCPT